MVSRAKTFPLPNVPEILEIEIDLPNASAAEQAAMIPHAERTANRTVKLVASSPREAISFVLVCYQFAAAALRSLLPPINR